MSVSKLPCQGFHVGHVINNLLVFWYTHPFPRHCVMRACKLNQLFQNRRKHYTKTRLFQKASTSFHCKLSSDHFWPPLHHFGPVHKPFRPTMSKNTSWSAEQKTMGIHLFLTTFWEAKQPLIIFIPDMEKLRFCWFQSTCPFQMGFQFSTLLVLSGLTCTVSVFGPFHMVHRWGKNKS